MTRHLITFCVILLLLAGCVGMPWEQWSGARVDNVQIALWVSHHSVKVRQPLQLRLTAHNLGNQIAIFESQTKPVLQLFITGKILRTNEVILGPRWPGEGALTPQLTHLELKPGETKTIVEMTWTPDERFDMALVAVGGTFRYGSDAGSHSDFAVPVTIGFF